MNSITRFIIILIATLHGIQPKAQTNMPTDMSEPQNMACGVSFNEHNGQLKLVYDGVIIAKAKLKAAHGKVKLEKSVSTQGKNDAITQSLQFTGDIVTLDGIVYAGDEAIAAEGNPLAQEKFALVRTTIGHASNNKRNNAIYDRYSDWVLEINTGHQVQIAPTTKSGNQQSFVFTANSDTLQILFKPLYYQKHKGITYFKPRTYEVWKEPVTGWSSWWAYFRQFNEKDLDQLLSVWKEKHLNDFGYQYIQIDDVFQGEFDKGHRAPEKYPHGYYATGPKTWLEWKKDLFPSGISGYVNSVIEAGFSPAVWIGSYFTATDTVEKHPDWFIQDSAGVPSLAPWISYAINSKNTVAVETLIRPLFKGLKAAGMEYVKIDQLRHYLYDNMNNNLAFFANKGFSADDVFRTYLKVAREELGSETFILSCWGVLPQSVGLVDACRIGGDGYGPVTMQQYNSWNGIVWINDPDHCDVYPNYKPAEAGNVTHTLDVQAQIDETKLRPSLASIAGCMLMLSDKPAVYQDDKNLEGVKRAAPVLPSVPGQLYDFDPVKTAILPNLNLQDIKSGADPTVIDADQFGQVCPWWLNEINRDFEQWNVLSRMNWSDDTMPVDQVNFADLGLDSNKEYLVFEFWNKTFLGMHKGNFEAATLSPNNIHTYSIREKTNHPQIVSTNRHISQGGYDLLNVTWKKNSLSGTSKVVAGDRYELYVHIPEGYQLKSATCNGYEVNVTQGDLVTISMMPEETGEVSWKLVF
ncbi:MAG: hypothetical protein ABJB16_07955 [Saprospiraceae bacterium]